METENVRKQLKINQNIWNMLWCIENANMNIQSKFHVPTLIFF